MARMAQIAGIAIERRRGEDALRESEAKFRSLFESVMDGVNRTTRDGRLLVVNPAFVQMLGYSSAEELYQVSAGSLYWYPSDRDTYVRRMESEGEVRDETGRLIAKSMGTFKYIRQRPADQPADGQ